MRDAALMIGAAAGLVLVFSNVWIRQPGGLHAALFAVGFLAAYLCVTTYLKDHGRWPPSRR